MDLTNNIGNNAYFRIEKDAIFCQRAKRREPKDVLMKRAPKSKKLKKFWLNKLKSFLCSATSPCFLLANSSLTLPRQSRGLHPQPPFLPKCPRLNWPHFTQDFLVLKLEQSWTIWDSCFPYPALSTMRSFLLVPDPDIGVGGKLFFL